MAAAEPRTLDAAFTDHAQRTVFGRVFSSRLSPVGNGIPMAKPTGLISATVISALTGSGSATPLSEIGATTAARVSTAATISTMARLKRPKSPRIRLLLAKLPQPLDSSMEKMMTVSA